MTNEKEYLKFYKRIQHLKYGVCNLLGPNISNIQSKELDNLITMIYISVRYSDIF